MVAVRLQGLAGRRSPAAGALAKAETPTQSLQQHVKPNTVSPHAAIAPVRTQRQHTDAPSRRWDVGNDVEDAAEAAEELEAMLLPQLPSAAAKSKGNKKEGSQNPHTCVRTHCTNSQCRVWLPLHKATKAKYSQKRSTVDTKWASNVCVRGVWRNTAVHTVQCAAEINTA